MTSGSSRDRRKIKIPWPPSELFIFLGSLNPQSLGIRSQQPAQSPFRSRDLIFVGGDQGTKLFFCVNERLRLLYFIGPGDPLTQTFNFLRLVQRVTLQTERFAEPTLWAVVRSLPASSPKSGSQRARGPGFLYRKSPASKKGLHGTEEIRAKTQYLPTQPR